MTVYRLLRSCAFATGALAAPCALLVACAAAQTESGRLTIQTIEPEQQHVGAEHRCPPITLSAEQIQALAREDVAVEQIVDRLIADQNIAIDSEHQARQASAQPVSFRLGPNTFSLRRNFFYSQNAPSAATEAVVNLSIQWPCLEPLPQGFNFANDKDASMRAISITARYLDPERITVPAAMQRTLLPLDPESPAQRANPLENLAMRLQGDAVHDGLVPYYADLDAVERYLRNRHPGNARVHSRENTVQLSKDWCIWRGPGGDPLSVIKCDNRELPDGLVIEGPVVEDDPAVQRRAACDHQFALPTLGIVVEMSYARAFCRTGAGLNSASKRSFAQPVLEQKRWRVSGLNNKDVEILSFYAENGNRELYWNYLAQKPGNDGYGLLALGVVRNDNVPGQVADAYAQSAALATRPGGTSKVASEGFGASSDHSRREGFPLESVSASTIPAETPPVGRHASPD